MSISETLLARERSDGKRWDWSALPIFLSRGHHWPYLYVNTASGIASLADMKGKRIGVPDYDMTAALWFRITLKDLYGIEAKDNVWFNGRTKALSHGGALGLDKAGPVGVTHHWLTVDQDPGRNARPRRDRRLHGDPPVRPGHRRRCDRHRPLGWDANRRQSATAEIVAGRRQGGRLRILPKDRFFQANHHVIVQNRILREHPWVALELFDAFRRSKEIAYERARRTPSDATSISRATIGRSKPTCSARTRIRWALRAMGKNIERAIRGSVEQGLLTKPLRLEDIYYRTTLNT